MLLPTDEFQGEKFDGILDRLLNGNLVPFQCFIVCKSSLWIYLIGSIIFTLIRWDIARDQYKHALLIIFNLKSKERNIKNNFLFLKCYNFVSFNVSESVIAPKLKKKASKSKVWVIKKWLYEIWCNWAQNYVPLGVTRRFNESEIKNENWICGIFFTILYQENSLDIFSLKAKE